MWMAVIKSWECEAGFWFLLPVFVVGTGASTYRERSRVFRLRFFAFRSSRRVLQVLADSSTRLKVINMNTSLLRLLSLLFMGAAPLWAQPATEVNAPLSAASRLDNAAIVPSLAMVKANVDVMNLRLVREKNGLTLRDIVDPALFVGKQIAYYLNGQYFGNSLQNFHPLPGTRLGVTKLILNPNDNALEFWKIQPQSKAQALLAIPEAPVRKEVLKAVAKPKIPSRNSIPAWYQDKSEFRASKFAPKFTMIENKINAGEMKRADATWQDTLNRAGWTHIEAEHVPPQSFYDPVQGFRSGLPSTHIFEFTGKKKGSELTRDEVRKAAEGFAPFGLLGDQFGEGETWFATDSDQAYWFYERAREIAADPRITWPTTFFGTYGGFSNYNVRGWNGDGGVQVSPDNPWFRKYYDDPKLALTSCSYFNRMYQVIDANVSWYPGDFAYATNFYQRVHSIQVMKMGQAQKTPLRRTFLFWWQGIENTDNGLIHNGFWWDHQTVQPPGSARYEEHPSVDLNAAIGLCLIGGFIIGDGVIGWDNNIQFDPDPDVVGRDQMWIPAGADTKVRRSERSGYAAHPVNVLDAQFIASQWYQTCARTSGAAWQYVRYRVDNGDWVLPEKDGSTILVRAADKNRLRNGVALARVKNRAVDWVFHNPMWLPNEEHTVTVEAGGRQWTQTVRGNETVLCNETLS